MKISVGGGGGGVIFLAPSELFKRKCREEGKNKI